MLFSRKKLNASKNAQIEITQNLLLIQQMKRICAFFNFDLQKKCEIARVLR